MLLLFFCIVVENVYLCFDITLKSEIDNLVFISVDMGDAFVSFDFFVVNISKCYVSA